MAARWIIYQGYFYAAILRSVALVFEVRDSNVILKPPFTRKSWEMENFLVEPFFENKNAR